MRGIHRAKPKIRFDATHHGKEEYPMGDRNETLSTYVGDMLALEQHLLEAFEKQVALAEGNPSAQNVVRQLVSSTKSRVTALEALDKTFGVENKGLTNTLKTAISGLFGVAAGVIDHIRPQSLSKALRDSYTATNHAIIGYVMLQTTGVALSDTATATLAEQHLQDNVKNAQAIANVMPSLVVKDLADDVEQVATGAASTVTGNQSISFLYH
jgi:ferritin-like metal-binding protein YciE